MDVDQLRQENEAKAEEEQQRGPVDSDPQTAPVGEAIEDFHARDALAFGIPAHRAGTGKVRPDAARWAGEQAFDADPGMNNGVDDRHQSWQVETTAMELFAAAVGADQTLFSTNGSSLNVHVALLTVARPGESVVMARNGHKSAFAALVLSGAMPVYVDPVYDERWQVAHGVEPDELDRVLAAHPEAKAAIMSPRPTTASPPTSNPSLRRPIAMTCRWSLTTPGASTTASAASCRRRRSTPAPTSRSAASTRP